MVGYVLDGDFLEKFTFRQVNCNRYHLHTLDTFTSPGEQSNTVLGSLGSQVNS